MLAVSIHPIASPPSPVNEPELDAGTIELCRAGNRAALESFVRCYQRRVFAFLSRALGNGLSCEDLAQEVFIRAYRALPDFSPDGNAQLSTWLLTIAYRVLVDARRRLNTREKWMAYEAAISTPSDPEASLLRTELAAALQRAASELPPEQRDAFVLAEFHGLGINEIATITGTQPATVKTRLFRARAQLRLRLADLWETRK